MIFILVSLLIPIALYALLPHIIGRVIQRPAQHNYALATACVLFFISWYLPSPLIEGKNTAFSTHFVGGGLFSGFLWLYLVKNLQWRPMLAVELGSLFAFTCTLGVMNELFEFALVQAGLTRLTLADTSWDLVANSLGMISFYLIFIGFRFIGKDSRR
jgi:hypothetical protein